MAAEVEPSGDSGVTWQLCADPGTEFLHENPTRIAVNTSQDPTRPRESLPCSPAIARAAVGGLCWGP